jgi:hypothetical protein
LDAGFSSNIRVTHSAEKHPPTHPGWGWLQKSWWFVRDVLHSLKPARFSFFVALAGAAIFLFVQQGTEILRALAEPNADTGKIELRPVFLFYGALIIWSLQSWYWARVLLDHPPARRTAAPDCESDAVVCWFGVHGPRILGVLPPLIVAGGCLFVAPVGYRAGEAGSPLGILYLFAAVAVLIALALYLFFIWRRGWIEQPADARARRALSLRESRWTVFAILLSSILAFALLVCFWINPVGVGLRLGSGAIVCLAAAAWVCFGSVVVLWAGRLKLPLVGGLLVWAMLCSQCNDNHAIRTIPAEGPVETAAALENTNRKRPVKEAFIAWHDAVQKAYPMAGPGQRPVFIVATEGGGIRAAYWTAIVLASLQDRSLDERKAWMTAHPGVPPSPDFASHLFAISGVSGGSLGAVVFNALLAEDVGYPLERKAHDILRQDFLSPTLGAMFFPDLVQRFLPWPFASADRAAALETAWEHGWDRTISGSASDTGGTSATGLAQPFRKLWRNWKGNVPLPALFLNGTRVESGRRIITSNLPITTTVSGEFSDSEDAEDQLGNRTSGRDIPLSTAAHMSARFTYVSPAGLLPGGGRVVDGGYFENSGAATALEVLYEIEAAIEENKWPETVVPVVIEIRNGPTEQNPDTRKDIVEEKKEPKHEEKRQREFLSEALSPLTTLFNTRSARATFSQEAIESEQESQREAHPGVTVRNRLRYGLHDSAVPLPLGWMLSGGAATEMRDQLQSNEENQASTGAVVEALLGTAALPVTAASPSATPQPAQASP